MSFVFYEPDPPSRVHHNIYISGEEIANDWGWMMVVGITHIIDVGFHVSYRRFRPAERRNGMKLRGRYSFKLDDDRDEDISVFFNPCIDFINRAIAADPDGTRILVHCAAGISRSVSIVMAWMIDTDNVTVETALAKIRSQRRVAGPNPGFIAQLKQFYKDPAHERFKYDCLRSGYLKSPETD